MVGLAKCLILAGDNGYPLASTNPTSNEQEIHGLSWRPHSAADHASRNGNGLLDEFCYVRSSPAQPGLYTMFRRCFALTDNPNGTRFSVKDLLTLVPDLQGEVSMHLDIPRL